MSSFVSAARLTLAGRRFVTFVGLTFVTGCIPYTVGSTAQTLPPEHRSATASIFFIPGGVQFSRDSALPLYGVDGEARFGIDDASDFGVRITSATGVVINYKRRLGDDYDSQRAAVAVMAGAGIVNLGAHLHFELTMLASAKQRSSLTPYGGLRIMQVAPIQRGAAHDSPTAGGFAGVRIGTLEMGVSPELAVYYDRSALHLRKRNVIFVPAVSLHGEELLRMLGIAMGAVGRRR